MRPTFTVISIAFLLCWTIACNNSSSADDSGADATDSGTIDMNQEIVSAENVFVYVPSPIETASLLKQAGANYNKDLLNQPQNVSHYSSTASQALNLGVYGTDLAFAGIFDQHAETMVYMDCTGKLANSLHVASAFSEDRTNRLESNMNNRDSVLSIITDTYWDCDALFNDNHQPQASALMIAGGWIEGLYLACRVAESTNNNDIRIRIAEQRSSLDKLIVLLDRQKHADVEAVAADLKKLKVLFDQLPKQKTESMTVTTDPGGTPVVGAENPAPPVSLNALEFKQILDQITAIRNGITSRS